VTILAPERIDDMVGPCCRTTSRRLDAEWPIVLTNIMIPRNADSVVAEAINKGFHGFDYRLAYDAVYRTP